MQIYLISNLNKPIQLVKNVSEYTIRSGHLKDGCSVVDPEIEFDYSQELNNYSYFFIPEFNRFYYLTARTVRGKKMSIAMHCDVLMTYKNDIRAAVGTVTRSMKGNDYIADNMVLNLPKLKRTAKKLGDITLTSGNYYLVQIGG